jgi:hypothetical protein
MSSGPAYRLLVFIRCFPYAKSGVTPGAESEVGVRKCGNSNFLVV